MGILIRGGTILTALDEARGDVLCEDGKIVALARAWTPTATTSSMRSVST